MSTGSVNSRDAGATGPCRPRFLASLPKGEASRIDGAPPPSLRAWSQAMDRLAAGLHHETGHRRDEVRVAVDRDFFAVQVGLAVGHRVDQAPALETDRFRESPCRQRGDFHQQLVGRAHAHRVVNDAVSWAEGLGVIRASCGWFQYCSDTVALALTAVLTSSIRVPRRTCGTRVEGVSNWSEASKESCTRRPSCRAGAFNSRLLPTQKPSKPGMMLIEVVRRAFRRPPEVVEDALDRDVIAVDVAADEGRLRTELNSLEPSLCP